MTETKIKHLKQTAQGGSMAQQDNLIQLLNFNTIDKQFDMQ